MTKNSEQSKKSISVSEKFIDQLYQLNPTFSDEKGNNITIPESGFLGLLSIGYKGTAILRKTRGQTHLYAKFTKGKKLVRKSQKPIDSKRKS